MFFVLKKIVNTGLVDMEDPFLHYEIHAINENNHNYENERERLKEKKHASLQTNGEAIRKMRQYWYNAGRGLPGPKRLGRARANAVSSRFLRRLWEATGKCRWWLVTWNSWTPATRHTWRTARTCAHSIGKLPGNSLLNSILGPDCRQSLSRLSETHKNAYDTLPTEMICCRLLCCFRPYRMGTAMLWTVQAKAKSEHPSHLPSLILASLLLYLAQTRCALGECWF